jgi:hypothetical protein
MNNKNKFRILNIRSITTLGIVLSFLALFSFSFVDAKTVITGSIDTSSLSSNSLKPTILGTVSGTKIVKITIQKEGNTKIFYKSNTIKVKDGNWKAKISKKLSNGNYEVNLFGSNNIKSDPIANGVLIINTKKQASSKSNATFVVATIPLLAGGTAHSGTSVPISYLQVNNIGKEEGTLKGFWIKQNGSASVKSIIGLSIVDDKGGSRDSVGGTEGSTPFKNGLAFVPTNSTFEPGQMRLFTIKAILTGDVSSHLGKKLVIDVVSADTNASSVGKFPIRGTTWVIDR